MTASVKFLSAATAISPALRISSVVMDISTISLS
jgi:hypothetical protein